MVALISQRPNGLHILGHIDRGCRSPDTTVLHSRAVTDTTIFWTMQTRRFRCCCATQSPAARPPAAGSTRRSWCRHCGRGIYAAEPSAIALRVSGA